MLLLALLACSALCVAALRYAARNGVWLPIGRGIWVRRWYAPVSQSDATLAMIQENLRGVCSDSIDAVLNYDVLQAKTPEDLRAALRNKVVMEIYSERDRRIVGFHILLWTPLNVHLGLVMIARCAQGRKLQQLTQLNMLLLVLDWACFRFRMSDLGYSPSAFRTMSETVYKTYPNLLYRVKCRQWHLDVANYLLTHHRHDMGISDNATFEPEHFIVRGSNAAEGGGAHELVSHCATRSSRKFHLANTLVDGLLRPEDEQLYVGEANLLIFLWRALPVVPLLPLIARYLGVFSILGMHNYIVANLTWYCPTVLKLMRIGFRKFSDPAVAGRPAIWVCNHFSYVDALAMHCVDPNVRIVAKADLATELPDGFFARFMVRVWTRGGFLWYKRGNDDSIRQRIADCLRKGQTVVIFAEGTSQREGPPMAMKAGAIDLAKECNVPLQTVALRYNLPIGLNREDSTVRNAKALVQLRNLDVGIKFGAAYDVSEKDVTIDHIRSDVTQLWEELGHHMRPIVPV